MPNFAFQARDKGGQPVSGVRDAPDQRAALESLRESGLFVTQLKPQSGRHAKSLPSRAASAAASSAASSRAGFDDKAILTGRASDKEMSLFFRQMHGMLNAGTALSHALNTLAQHASNAALRQACREMSVRVADGTPWSQTLRRYPGLFSPLMIGLIEAGEAGGFLDRMCLRLSEYAERDYQIQQTIKRETWYPKLLVFASILIPSVVPLVLTSIGVQKGNPLLAWLGSVIGPLSLVGGAWLVWKIINYLAPVAARDGALRQAVDSLKLAIPVVGKTVRGFAAAKFCRALSGMYAAGAAPHRSVRVAAGACGNAAMAQRTREMIPRLERGDGLTDALADTGHFQPVVLQMLRTGEESGDIDGQLEKVAEFLEQDAEVSIQQSVKVLGIVVYLFIATYIGVQVISFWTGYFNNIMDGI